MTDQYKVPNRAVALTVVASSPINENWELIEDGLNKNYKVGSEALELGTEAVNTLEDKLDKDEKGAASGLATLNENQQLTSSELPEEARGHVYEVDTLNAQLTLVAYPGDICVRTDLGKTYALSKEGASTFSNWIQIASVDAGGEIGGNPPYKKSISANEWELASSGYSQTYTNEDHGQGNTSYLLVVTKNSYGENINCNYTVSDDGEVTIYSDTMFDGDLIISNLEGNVENKSYVPYSVNIGAYSNGSPLLLSTDSERLILNCEPTIILVDGLSLVQSISSADDTIVNNVSSGRYIVFVDSVNITNNHLSKLTYLSSNQYLGVLDELPSSASSGDRCYIKYDKSYVYDEGWKTKAFTPIGEFQFSTSITSVKTYEYNQNGFTVNSTSHVFDYLFGNKIEGLNISCSSGQLFIGSGKILVGDRLIETEETSKFCTRDWEDGDSLGCFDNLTELEDTTIYSVTDGETTYYTSTTGEAEDTTTLNTKIYTDESLTTFYKYSEDEEFMYTGDTTTSSIYPEGFYYLYILGNGSDYDFYCSFSDEPTIPDNYTDYRRIGYIYKTLEGFIDMTQLNNHFTFGTSLTYDDLIITEDSSSIDCGFIPGIVLNLYFNPEDDQVVTFSSGIQTYFKGKSTTIKLPVNSSYLIYKGEAESKLDLEIFGFEDPER